MKTFTLSSRMTTVRGVFYPTGHIVLMFPTEQDALHAAKVLQQDGVPEDDIFLATPKEFERQITGAADDILLPSVGTEAETALHFRELAHAGHYALIVHCTGKLSSGHVLDLLKDSHCSYGQRYRFLVIEDLVC